MTIAVYLDTNVFISAFETTTERSNEMWAVLDAVAAGDIEGLTSELSLAELLPKPMSLSQSDLVDGYLDLLSGLGAIGVRPVNRAILIQSAALRVQHPRLRLADAIHVATAVVGGCTALLSDDRRLPVVDGLHNLRCGPTSLSDIRFLAR